MTEQAPNVTDLLAALANSPYELAQCDTCGELTIHLPQGLSPLCLKCARGDEDD